MRRQDFNLALYGLSVFLAVVILALVVWAIDALSRSKLIPEVIA